MFFIFSKILYFLLQPLNWVVGLMLFSLFTKNKKRKHRAIIASVTLALFFSNHLIFNQAAKLWELKTITAGEITEPYDVGILLGGYANNHIVPRHDRQNFSARANRFMNAYELYKSGKVKKLLLTGGTGELIGNSQSEAVTMREFLLRIGMPATDIIVEGKSRNTYENAVFTKQMLTQSFQTQPQCLLLTSALHMRRSAGCFKKEGVAFTPFSVDFLREDDQWNPQFFLIPDPCIIKYWESMLKEWVGWLAYRLKGYL
ncbi:MAG: YdcF family protein [Saprospiraceae bacterium]|nr:MAG: YdcF family protein [Saprospiraceae bacterium]